MPLKIIIPSISLLIILLLVTITLPYFSLWHLWEMLPPGEMKLAVNRTLPGPSLFEPYLLRQLPAFKGIEQTRRYAISRYANGNYSLAATPSSWPGYKSLLNQLSQAGWSISKRSPIIIAHLGSVPPSLPLKQSYPRAISALFSRAKPARPIIVGHVLNNSLPMINQPLYLIAALDKASPNSTIALTLNSSYPGFSLPKNINNQQDNYLQVALPSAKLSSLPLKLQDYWKQYLSNNLPFKSTNPDLWNAILKQEKVFISNYGESLAVTVAGNTTDFYQQISAWVSREEAYSRPLKQSYLLPDRTLAYEYVAGEPRDLLQPAGDNCAGASWPDQLNLSASGSDSSSITRHEIWLCKNNDNHLTFSQNLAQAKDTPNWPLEPNNWLINLPAFYLKQFNLPIKSITASGNDQQGSIFFRLEEK